jgi:hypothetical protein
MEIAQIALAVLRVFIAITKESRYLAMILRRKIATEILSVK